MEKRGEAQALFAKEGVIVMCVNINNQRLENWQGHRHEHKSVDLLDRMHVHSLNHEQQTIEHNSLDYWLKNYAVYDLAHQATYLETINGFFRKQLEEYIDEQSVDSPWHR